MTEGERLIWAAAFVQGGEDFALGRVNQFRGILSHALDSQPHQRSAEENMMIDFVCRPSAAESYVIGATAPAGVFEDEVSGLRRSAR